MIAKLECTQSNAQQNIEQLQNPRSTKMLSSHGGLLTITVHHRRDKQSNQRTMMKQRKGFMTLR